MSARVKKIILLLTFALFLLAGAGIFCMRTETRHEASAEEKPAKLLLPSSYEQFLSLTSPSAVAFSEKHIVIADGNSLFICDRTAGAWTEYRHLGAGGLSRTITSVGIAEGETDRIFFADDISRLYEYTESTSSGEYLTISCANFLIAEGYLYTANVSSGYVTFCRYDLAKELIPANEIASEPIQSNATPCLTYLNGNLVAVIDTWYIASYDGETLKEILPRKSLNGAGNNPALQSVCAFGGRLYYTLNSEGEVGGIYCSDLAGGATRIQAGAGYSALAYYGEQLYVLKNSSVLGIDPESEQFFTGYEIASASSSVNRLSGATQTARAGDLLVTADGGNGRVSVYNIRTGEYSALSPEDGGEFNPQLVATDGDLIAVSEGANIYTCRYGENSLKRTLTARNTVNGLVCVYGNVYYVTNDMWYGKLGEESTVFQNYGIPTAMTSNLYGDIFVAYGGAGSPNSIYRFNERDFLKSGSGERLDAELPAGYTSLRADFEGNLYYLNGEKLFRLGRSTPLLELDGADYVSTEGTALPTSFALGFEDKEVYFLFGEFMLSCEVEIPTLNRIGAEGVSSEVFAEHGKENLLIDVPAGTIGVRTDLNGLKDDPDFFPYEFYYRTAEDLQGVLLAQKGDYALVVLYEISEDTRVFTATLFRIPPEERDLVNEADYFKEAMEDGYLSSAVSSYRFPCLHPSLASETLKRGTAVHVEGIVTAHGREYALLSYGEGQHGFVPAAYITEVDPLKEEGGAYQIVYVKQNEGGIVFTAEDGSTVTVTERTKATAVRGEDGSYTVRIQKDGKLYTAQLSESAIERGENDALRISLIVILCVLACTIIGVYIYLVPYKYRKQKN